MASKMMILTPVGFQAHLDDITKIFEDATSDERRAMLEGILHFAAHASQRVHQPYNNQKEFLEAGVDLDELSDSGSKVPNERKAEEPHLRIVRSPRGAHLASSTTPVGIAVAEDAHAIPINEHAGNNGLKPAPSRAGPDAAKHSVVALAPIHEGESAVEVNDVNVAFSPSTNLSSEPLDSNAKSTTSIMRRESSAHKKSIVSAVSGRSSTRSSVMSVGDFEMMELEKVQKDLRAQPPDGAKASNANPQQASMSVASEVDNSLDMDGEEEDFIQSDRSHICIINPNSRGRTMWDMIGLQFVLLDSILLPFEMSYQGNKKEGPLYFVGMTFFSVDIVFNFMTGYTEKGILVLAQKRIIHHYLKTWFVIDLLSTVPIHLMVSVGGAGSNMRLLKVAKLAKLLRLMRLLRLLKLNKLLERIEAYFESVYVIHVINLIKVLLVIIFFCHWNACLWWAVGHPDSLFFHASSSEDEESREAHWTTQFRMPFGITGGQTFRWIDKPIHESYMFCLYWTLGVMRTMPSEVYPLTFTERLYCMLFMFFAFSLFAACVAKITGILSKIGARRAEFDERMAYLRKFMRDLQCPITLQDNVKQYLEHLFETRRIMASEDELKRVLSEHLTAELNVVRYNEILRKEAFFQKMSNPVFKRVLLISVNHLVSPGDIITHKDEIPSTAICVMSGVLRHFESKRKRLKEIDNGGNARTSRMGSVRATIENIRSSTKRSSTNDRKSATANSLGISSAALTIKRVYPGEWIDLDVLIFEGHATRQYNTISESFSELFFISRDRFMDLRNKWPALDKCCRKHLKVLMRSRNIGDDDRPMGRETYLQAKSTTSLPRAESSISNAATGGCTPAVLSVQG